MTRLLPLILLLITATTAVAQYPLPTTQVFGNLTVNDTTFVGPIRGEGPFVFSSEQDSLIMGIIGPYGGLGPLRVDGIGKLTKLDGLGGFLYVTYTDSAGGDEQIIISPDILGQAPGLRMSTMENSFDIGSYIAAIQSDSNEFSIQQQGYNNGWYGIYMDPALDKLTIANGDLIEFQSDSISYYNSDPGTYGTGWRYTPNDFWVTYINELPANINRSQFLLRPNSTVLTVTDSTDGNRPVGLTIENFGYLWLGEAGFDSTNAWFLMYDEFVGMQGQTASIRGWNSVQITSGAGATQSGLFTYSTGEIQLYAAQGQPAEINAGPNSELILQDSTVSVTGQLILDSYTGVEASAITPQPGMMIYVTSTNGVFNQTGFWAYDGAWVRLH